MAWNLVFGRFGIGCIPLLRFRFILRMATYVFKSEMASIDRFLDCIHLNSHRVDSRHSALPPDAAERVQEKKGLESARAI